MTAEVTPDELRELIGTDNCTNVLASFLERTYQTKEYEDMLKMNQAGKCVHAFHTVSSIMGDKTVNVSMALKLAYFPDNPEDKQILLEVGRIFYTDEDNMDMVLDYLNEYRDGRRKEGIEVGSYDSDMKRST